MRGSTPPELVAMSKSAKLIDPLPEPQQKQVVAYLVNRYLPESDAFLRAFGAPDTYSTAAASTTAVTSHDGRRSHDEPLGNGPSVDGVTE